MPISFTRSSSRGAVSLLTLAVLLQLCTPQLVVSPTGARHLDLLPRAARAQPAPSGPPPTAFETPAGLAESITVARQISPARPEDVQDGQVTITYTVFNRTAEILDGILLATTLAPDIAIPSASPEPDRLDQELAWSLGSLEPYASTEVTLALDISSATAIDLDSGAAVYALRGPRPVSASTVPARLVPVGTDASLLECPVDANCTDPYVVAKAAELGNDAARIFEFVSDEIGYEVYQGSLRGARGTLWSKAGNALDQASLLVALLRASGIPARYVRGTFDPSIPVDRARLQSLILSMFPEEWRFVGIEPPPDVERADPANDEELLAEAAMHDWVEFDDGVGFRAADPTIPGAQIGETFATFAEVFEKVPEARQHSVTIRLRAEFGSLWDFGNPPSPRPVLQETFTSAELVGKPLTVGHFVNGDAFDYAFFRRVTYTYSPYLIINQIDGDPLDDEIIRGDDFEEFYDSSFGGLSQSYLTGLFLQMDVRKPGSEEVEHHERPIVDRIGYVARQTGGQAAVEIPKDLVTEDPLPAVLPFETTTIELQSARFSSEYVGAVRTLIRRLAREAPPSGTNASATEVGHSSALLAVAGLARMQAIAIPLESHATDAFGARAYAETPKVLIAQSDGTLVDNEFTAELAIDLRSTAIRVVPRPGQPRVSAAFCRSAIGVAESIAESIAVDDLSPGEGASAVRVLLNAIDQDKRVLVLTERDQPLIDRLRLSRRAKLRISNALESGHVVVTPSELSSSDTALAGWFELDPTTGAMRGVLEDGSFGFFETQGLYKLVTEPLAAFASGFASGLLYYGFLSGSLILDDALAEILNEPQVADLDPLLGGLKRSLEAWAWENPVGLCLPFVPTPAGIGPPSLLNLCLPWTWWGTRTPGLLAWDAALVALGQASFALGINVLASRLGVDPSVFPIVTSPPKPVSLRRNLVTLQPSIAGSASLNVRSFATSVRWQKSAARESDAAAFAPATTGLGISHLLPPPGDLEPTSFDQLGRVQLSSGSLAIHLAGGGASLDGGQLLLPVSLALDRVDGSLDLLAGLHEDEVALDAISRDVLLLRSSAARSIAAGSEGSVVLDIRTSAPGQYEISVDAPASWHVAIGSDASVTLIPSAGTPVGTQRIVIAARSHDRPALMASVDVDINVTDPAIPGVDAELVADALFTVPSGGAQLPSAFRALVRNRGPATDTFALAFPNPPPGFELIPSRTSLTIPPGETGEIGIYLEPVGALPDPGTQTPVTFVATSVSAPAVTDEANTIFTVPEVHEVVLSFEPFARAVSPGDALPATLTIQSLGNVDESVALATALPTGIDLAGLPASLSLARGAAVEIPVTLSVAADAAVDQSLLARVTGDLCNGQPADQCAVPDPKSRTGAVELLVRSPETVAAANAALEASAAGNFDVAAAIGALEIDLGLLQATPTDTRICTRIVGRLDELARVLRADRALASLAPSLDGLATSAMSCDAAALLAATPAAFDPIGDFIGQASRASVELALVPSLVWTRPNVPVEVQVRVTGSGREPTSFSLAADALTPSLAADLPPGPYAVEPDQTIEVPVTVTPSESGLAFFEVRASVAGAPLLAPSVQGNVVASDQALRLVRVEGSPSFVVSGTPTQIQIWVANESRLLQVASATTTIKNRADDPNDPPEVETTTSGISVPAAAVQIPIALETIETAGLADGTYDIRVELSDATGRLLGVGMGTLGVGIPISATIASAPEIVPPGASEVTSTIRVARVAGASGSYSEAVLADEPIAYWPFEEGEGVTAGDVVDPPANGTLTNGAHWTTDTFATGSEAAIEFDGVEPGGGSDFVLVGDQAKLRTPELSFEAWFRASTDQTYRLDTGPMIVRSRTSGYQIGLISGGFLQVYVATQECGDQIILEGSSTVDDAVWHHVALTLSSDGVRLYLDGEEEARSTSNATVCFGGGQVAFGRDGDQPDDYFRGSLDEIAWYDHALPAERVRDHYCAGSGICASAGGSDTLSSPLVVPATANIFGAGHAGPPLGNGGIGVLPVLVDVPLFDEGFVTIESIGGEVTPNGALLGYNDADGQFRQGTDISSADGISGIKSMPNGAPHNMFMVGVFLGHAEPAEPAPPALDFSDNLDFTELSPDLHQTFFIGDGRNANDVVQQFTVPAGATRLYLGFADAQFFTGPPGAYQDNEGQLQVAVRSHGVGCPVGLVTDKASFLASTHAVSATGALPDEGLVAGGAAAALRVGAVTFSIRPPAYELFVGARGVPNVPGDDWTSRLPGPDIAISDRENLVMKLDEPVHALGFEVVEPQLDFLGAPPLPPFFDSQFVATLLRDGEIVDSFSFNVEPEDVAAFVGLVSRHAFDEVRLEEVVGGIDDEYFGEVFTAESCSFPRTSTLAVDHLVRATPDVDAVAGSFVPVAQGPTPTSGGDLVHWDAELLEPPPPTDPAPIVGGQLYSTGQPVSVEVLGASASITSDLWLLEPAPARFLATNRENGKIVELGTYPFGAELVFGIRTGTNEFRMGPQERNSDDHTHARVDVAADGSADVGFEDVAYPSGDFDYDDCVFRFRGGIALDPTEGTQAFSLRTLVTDMQPGETRQISNGTTVTSFGVEGTAEIELPPQFVTARHILSLLPEALTVQPGHPGTYTLRVENPTAAPVLFDLSLNGVAAERVSLASSVEVGAGATIDVPLGIATRRDDPEGPISFLVQAQSAAGIADAAAGVLTVDGEPIVEPPVASRRAVSIEILPPSIVAGRGTSALQLVDGRPESAVARVTNLGAATDTFSLSATFAGGLVGSLGETSITLLPGLGAYRDVVIPIQTLAATAPGPLAFTVRAENSATSDEATGTITVLDLGVDVALAPASGEPGDTFEATVTNLGSQTETFALTLDGSAKSVASEIPAAATLAPGASTQFGIAVGAVDYALPGTLDLVVRATSQTNPAVLDQADASIEIETHRGLALAFDPALTELEEPGDATLRLEVRNTGNQEEGYAARIVSTSGDLTAALDGLDGAPTQSIAEFRLPALASGAIQVPVVLASAGEGAVTVEVRTLEGAIVQTATGIVRALVENVAPIADAGADVALAFGGSAALDGSASSDPDAGPQPLAFAWSFASIPPGSALADGDIAGASSAEASFTPDAKGEYHLQLTVTDGDLSASDEVVVRVLNNPPVAVAGTDRSEPIGSCVVLDGSDSFDLDRDLIGYEWSVTASPPESAVTSESLLRTTRPDACFRADAAGRYELELVVDDGTDASTPDAVVIDVYAENAPPNAHAGSDRNAVSGTSVELDGSASRDTDGGPAPLAFAWSFVEVPPGSALADASIEGSTSAAPSFVADVAGPYRIRLEVSDGAAAAEDVVTITAFAPGEAPPNADAGVDQVAVPGVGVLLDGSGSVDPDAAPAPLSYRWRVVSRPPGSAVSDASVIDATTPSPSLSPDVEGAYVLSLEVSDGAASDRDHVLLVVGEGHPTDVTDLVEITTVRKLHGVLVPGTHFTAFDLTIRNVSSESIQGPLELLVAAEDEIEVKNASRRDPDGRWVVKLTAAPGLAALQPGDTIGVVLKLIHAAGIDPAPTFALRGASPGFRLIDVTDRTVVTVLESRTFFDPTRNLEKTAVLLEIRNRSSKRIDGPIRLAISTTGGPVEIAQSRGTDAEGRHFVDLTRATRLLPGKSIQSSLLFVRTRGVSYGYTVNVLGAVEPCPPPARSRPGGCGVGSEVLALLFGLDQIRRRAAAIRAKEDSQPIA